MEFEVYSIGLCQASVCTSLSIKEATDWINGSNPTGINSKWSKSKAKSFKCGTPNGCACPDHKGNKHFLFSC